MMMVLVSTSTYAAPAISTPPSGPSPVPAAQPHLGMFHKIKHFQYHLLADIIQEQQKVEFRCKSISTFFSNY